MGTPDTAATVVDDTAIDVTFEKPGSACMLCWKWSTRGWDDRVDTAITALS